MGQVLLVRHGQASWGTDDYDVLSPTGERQADALGAALRELRPDVLVHGALQRQRRTAEVLAAAARWGVVADVDARWDEMDHEAVMDRQPPPAFAGARPDPREFQAWFELATTRWQSGAHDGEYTESFSAFTDRCLAALDDVVVRAGTGTAVVVTSGGPIAAVCRRLLDAGVPTYAALARVVANASVTRLVLGRRGVSLVSFNEIGLLPSDLITYR